MRLEIAVMEKERAPQATMESLRRDDTAYDRGRRRQNVTSVLLLLLNNIDLVACPLFRGIIVVFL